MLETAPRHPRRERILQAAIASAFAKRCYLSVLESETLARDGVDAWRALLKVHHAEKAQLEHRIDKATRLAVRLDYTPQERRDRDEEREAELIDLRIEGREHEAERVPAWEMGGES